MELFYALTSPYARKILLVADHLELSDQISLTAIDPVKDTSGKLPAVNPLDKIPTLILDSGEAIYDSPVIAEVLFNMVDAPALSFAERLKQQKMQALADGIMDAAFSLQMEKIRQDAEQSLIWQDRWRNAIIRAVGEFEKNMIGEAGDWHIGSMSMACALDYLGLRHPDISWQNGNDRTDAWYQVVREKAIMKKTDPRKG